MRPLKSLVEQLSVSSSELVPSERELVSSKRKLRHDTIWET